MRRVLISGGGSGIGLACAQSFLANGDRVLLCGRNEERLEEARRGLETDHPSRVEVRVCDISSVADVDALASWLKGNDLRVDVLVNNAGLFLASPALKAEEEDARRMWETQVMGPWRLLKVCAAADRRGPDGLAVVNIISVTALKPYASCGFYGATKAALKNLMATARAELRQKGVRITNIYPGATETPIWGDREMDFDRMMDAASVAKAVVASCDMSSRSLVEDLVMRPTGGDL